MTTQRKEERLTINREFNSLDAFIAEYVTNISRSGVFIRSKAPLPIGTKVNLEFNIIMDEGFETVKGVGEVVRTVDTATERGMGVVFTELTEYSKELINKLFTRRAMPGAAAVRGGNDGGDGA
jgi:uncharacterized protein (TIGR02266 family)